MDSFVSNNFATSLLLQVDGNNVIDTIINKSTFESEIIKEGFIYLYDYGALVFNRIEIQTNRVDIVYTIIVPLSDVDSVFKAEVYYNGVVIVKYL